MSLFHFPRPLSDRFCSVSSDTPRHPSHTHSRDFTYERLAPLFILHHYCLPFYPRPPPPRVPYSSPSASLLLPCRRVSVWPLLLSLSSFSFFLFFFSPWKGKISLVLPALGGGKRIRRNERFFSPPPLFLCLQSG